MEEESEESSSEDEAITSGKLTLEYFLKKFEFYNAIASSVIVYQSRLTL